MSRRLQNVTWVEAVKLDDPRVLASPHDKKVSAVMYVHLDMIRAFLDSNAEYGVICEDDVHIRRDFEQSIHVALDAYRRLKLDVLLAGYLLPYKPIDIHAHHSLAETPFCFLEYGDDLWGTQMYILGRDAAARTYNTFCDPTKVPIFASDWTITKYGRRAMMYPMLAVEEGYVNTDHAGQVAFHRACCDAHYDPVFYT